MRRRIFMVPTPWKHPFGNLSIHLMMHEDALTLSQKYDVTVFSPKEWGFPEGPYEQVTGETFNPDLPIGSITPELGAKFAKALDNKTLVLVYDPITPFQLGGLLYNHFVSRPFLFPKFSYRFLSDVPGTTREPLWRSSFFALVTSSSVFWNSPQVQVQTRKVLAKFGVHRFQTKNWYTVPLPVDLDAIDEAKDHLWPREETFTLRAPWNRIADAKNPDVFAEEATKFGLLTGAKTQIPLASRFLMSGDHATVKRWRENPTFQVMLDHHTADDRQTYFRSLGAAHAFLSVSKHESFGLAMLEYLMSGQVGVYLDVGDGYTKYVLPKYPFVVPRDELVPTLVWVKDNYEEAQRMVEPFRTYVREHYSRAAVNRVFFEAVEHAFATQVDRGEA